MNSVFLSYSSTDKVFVTRLAERLNRAGVKVWLDKTSIRRGKSITSQIESAINSADCFLPVISKRSLESTWVKKEWELALLSCVNKPRKILPVLVDDAGVPSVFESFEPVDFHSADRFDLSFACLLSLFRDPATQSISKNQKEVPRIWPSVWQPQTTQISDDDRHRYALHLYHGIEQLAGNSARQSPQTLAIAKTTSDLLSEALFGMSRQTALDFSYGVLHFVSHGMSKGIVLYDWGNAWSWMVPKERHFEAIESCRLIILDACSSGMARLWPDMSGSDMLFFRRSFCYSVLITADIIARHEWPENLPTEYLRRFENEVTVHLHGDRHGEGAGLLSLPWTATPRPALPLASPCNAFPGGGWIDRQASQSFLTLKWRIASSLLDNLGSGSWAIIAIHIAEQLIAQKVIYLSDFESLARKSECPEKDILVAIETLSAPGIGILVRCFRKDDLAINFEDILERANPKANKTLLDGHLPDWMDEVIVCWELAQGEQ